MLVVVDEHEIKNLDLSNVNIFSIFDQSPPENKEKTSLLRTEEYRCYEKYTRSKKIVPSPFTWNRSSSRISHESKLSEKFKIYRFHFRFPKKNCRKNFWIQLKDSVWYPGRLLLLKYQIGLIFSLCFQWKRLKFHEIPNGYQIRILKFVLLKVCWQTFWSGLKCNN